MGFLVFILTFIIYHIIGCNLFPVSEDNVLLSPDWYIFVGFGICILVTFVFKKVTNKKPKLTKTNWIFAGPKKRYSMAVRATENFGYVSESYLQRRFGISYEKARNLADRLVLDGVAARLTTVYENKESNRSVFEGEQRGTENPIQTPPQDKTEQSEFLKYGGANAELLTVDLMEGHNFEYWCASILRKNGFSSAEVTPGSGDHGVDVVAEKDEVRYAIQCKCYHSDLGNKPIQEVYAGKEMYGCQVGAVMTNRHFTKGAKELAEKTRVLLWDRDKLSALIESAEKDF